MISDELILTEKMYLKHVNAQQNHHEGIYFIFHLTWNDHRERPHYYNSIQEGN